MDYFNVIVLIIVIFVFVSDRKIKSVREISKLNNNIDIEIEKISKNLKVLKVNMDDIDYTKFIELVNKEKKEYILIQNKSLNLKENDYEILIANYANTDKKIAAFNVVYKYKKKKRTDFFKSIYINGINYLNIFNKYELTSYGGILFSKKDLENIKNKNNKIYIKNIVSYLQGTTTKLNIYYNRIDKKMLKTLYLKKIKRSSFEIILKVLLLIFAGSSIFANVIFNVLNFNLASLVVALTVYYCYTYVVRYMYSSLGFERYIVTYIFPVYFLIYIIVSLVAIVKKE